jgi:hypothetical protein
MSAELAGAMLAEVSADLVQRAGRDLGAIAQARHQLAVIDHETAEGGLGRLRRAAKFPDLAQDLLRGAAGCTSPVDPHGCSHRGFHPRSRSNEQPP